MAPVGWALLSSGLLVLWCGLTCRNPVIAVRDALTNAPPDKRQGGCTDQPLPTVIGGPGGGQPFGGTGSIERASPIVAGSGAVAAAGYLKGAGFRGVSLIQAIAVSGAETSGTYSTTAVGDTGIQTDKWGPSVGFMQVRSLKAEKGTGQWRDETRLTDPVFCARASYAISAGGVNFTPWTTYSKGTYRRYLNEAKDAAAKVGG